MRARQISNLVRAAIDASGNVNGLTVPKGVLPLAKSIGNTAVIIGDSITAQNLTGYTYAGVATQGLMPYNASQSYYGFSLTQAKGFMSWLQVMSSNAFIPVYNGGNSGERSDTILARASTSLAYAPKWVFELSGINDVNQLVSLFSSVPVNCENAIYNNRTAMWAAAKAIGANVVALAVMPPQITGNTLSAIQLGIISRVNRRLRDYATNNGIFWVDIHAALVDQTNVNGLGIDAYFDGTIFHPNSNGAYQIAKTIWAKISGFVQPFSGLISSQVDCYSFDNTSKNLLPAIDGLFKNGTNTTAQTGTTGTFPAPSGGNLWLLDRVAGSTNTGIISVQTSPDGIGNSTKAVLTSTVAEDAFRMHWASGTPSISILPAGTQVYFECAIKITGMTNLKGINAQVIVAVTGGVNAGLYPSVFGIASISGETGITDATGFTGVIRSPCFNVPADCTAITLLRAGLQPTFSGAGGATIEMWRCAINKV